jgi:hypothetical protein
MPGTIYQKENRVGEGDSNVDPGMAYVKATRESIATTPVEGTGIIDIVKGFQVYTLLCPLYVNNKLMYIFT